MLKQHKKYPAFEDTDLMPFGKHKGQPLQDVPAKYLAWLWNEGMKSSAGKEFTSPDAEVRVKLANYIWNSKDAIVMETGEDL